MAIPLIDDLIEWLYLFLGRIGWVLIAAGLLLGGVMVSFWIHAGELPGWSALALGFQLPQTSIQAIDSLLTYWWTARLGIPCSLLVVGVSLSVIFGRWASQVAKAEAELYSNTDQPTDPSSLGNRWALRFPVRTRRRARL